MLHVRNWSVVCVFRSTLIQNPREGHKTNEQDESPVEGCWRNIVLNRPKRPEERPAGVEQSKTVDCESCLPKWPAGTWQWLFAESSEGHAADGEDVGGHEG